MKEEAQRFRGVGVALVTPMTSEGAIDYGAFADHVEWTLSGEVDFLVPCGTTGENVTMTVSEQIDLIRQCVDVANGRAPVMAGAGTNSTQDAAERARAMAEAGADAILSVSPYYNRPTQEGLFHHYRVVSDAAAVPLFIYNVPGRTASNIEPETVFRMARELPRIVGIKEAAGDMDQAMTLIRDRPDGFVVLSGEDNLIAPMTLMGGDGVISVVANEVPDRVSALVRAIARGATAEAIEIHESLLPLMRANFVQTNPIPVKAALERMGRFEAHMRLPMTALDPRHLPLLEDALRTAGVVLPTLTANS